MKDNINHPDHYKTRKGLETIDVIEAFTENLSGSFATDTGSILKYICRWSKKNGLEDLEKARWYLNHLIESVEKTSRDDNERSGNSWDTVISSLDDGSYKTKFHIGDIRSLDLGPLGVIRMRLVGMDVDFLADSHRPAKLTWIADDVLSQSINMIDLLETDEVFNAGKEQKTCWENSYLRRYLAETVELLIPQNIRERIATVSKIQNSFTSGFGVFQEVTKDALWIPSHDELSYYSAVSGSFCHLRKYKSDCERSVGWWLRDATTTDTFKYTSAYGECSSCFGPLTRGVVLGFCLD